LNSLFGRARAWAQPRHDPLVLDLDGDGLETTGIGGAPVLFDGDGDGVKTGTGWLKGDDAFLALDKNGNGTIDNGNELFGVDTVLANGQKAADGFAALADLDSNHDGLFSSLDAQFANVRLWRDLNQNGVSDAGELQTLAAAGIVSLGLASTATHLALASTATHLALAGDNVQTAAGTYTRGDGQTGGTGHLDLAQNPFHRQFTDTRNTDAVADVPDLQGSGAVRDLREAASASPDLAAALRQLVADAATGSRADFRTAVATIIDRWADSANFSDSFETAAATDQDLFFVLPGVSVLEAFNAHYKIIEFGPDGYISDTPARQKLIRAQQAHIERLLKTLETFNGLPFVSVPGSEPTSGTASSTVVAFAPPPSSGGSGTVVGGDAPLIYGLEQDRLNLLNQSYQALLQSVCDGLVLQTRLKPLLDTIGLQIDGNGIRLDFSALNAEFDRRLAANPLEGFGDLMDFNRSTRDMLKDSGWQGWTRAADLLANDPLQASFRNLLATEGALVKGTTGFTASGDAANDLIVGDNDTDSLSGNAGDDVLFGLEGNDVLASGDGDDTLDGGAGNDTFYGGAGNDTLDGGAGNDTLYGGQGDDTYQFKKGDGADGIIENYDGYYGAGGGTADKIRFLDVASTEVTALRSGYNLILQYGSDSLTISEHFGGGANQIERIEFADGMAWDLAAIQANVTVRGTTGNDNLYGLAVADRMYGLEGNDVLASGDGDDTLDGGVGNDTFYGGAGNDTLDGGAGNDTLYGGQGDDTYQFKKGDGADGIIENYDGYYGAGGGTADKIRFLDVASTEVTALRSGYNLILQYGSDSLTISEHFGGGANQIERIEFADGMAWDLAAIQANVTVRGTTGNDNLYGLAVADRMYGLEGNDVLASGDGDDTLDGGVGNDILSGGLGNDTYLLARGGGADMVVDTDTTVGNNDLAQFGAGIASDQLWFRHVGNDLEVSVIGGNDKLTIQNWYGGTANHVERFQTADNKRLLDSQVETLVQAMAAFAPPSAGQATLPPAYQTTLAPVLAANWQ